MGGIFPMYRPRSAFRRALGVAAAALGVLLLIRTLPTWVWPALLGIGLTAFGYWLYMKA
ncbi:MAG: hypothetical protein IMW86_04055 [Hydrogenibacillus sp.]|nr:hypothetical protein [Hydrogenibacillus sp.]